MNCLLYFYVTWRTEILVSEVNDKKIAVLDEVFNFLFSFSDKLKLSKDQPRRLSISIVYYLDIAMVNKLTCAMCDDNQPSAM